MVSIAFPTLLFVRVSSSMAVKYKSVVWLFLWPRVFCKSGIDICALMAVIENVCLRLWPVIVGSFMPMAFNESLINTEIVFSFNRALGWWWLWLMNSGSSSFAELRKERYS